MGNKKIVYQVTREYMKKNKKRTFTTLFGIIFMVMLMTCVFVGKDTAINYLEELAAKSKGKWHECIYDINKEEYDQLKELEGVEQIVISDDYDYTVFDASANLERPYLQVKVYEEESFDLMNIELADGRLPKDEGEIVLSIEALNDGADIKIGDTVSVDCFERYIVKDASCKETTIFPYYGFEIAPGEKKEAPQGFPYYEANIDFYEEHEATGFTAEYEVVGFIEVPNYENKEAAAYTGIVLVDEVVLTGEFNVALTFDLDKVGNYYGNTSDIVGEDNTIEYNGMLLAFSGNSADNTINQMVLIMTVFFVTLIIIASVILIYNVFNISFEERSKYLGMLSSVGATGKQKRSSVYYEAFSLLTLALPLGFILGLGVVKLGMKAIKPYLDTFLGIYSGVSIDKVALDISLTGVLFTAIFAIFTVWISAYLPARKIGKIGPIECIRGNISKKKKTHKLNERVIKFFGVEGMLANNSIKREKKKTKGIVGAAAVFIIILIITSFSTKMLTTMITYIMVDDGTMNVKFDYDYGISPYYSDDYEQYDSIKEQLMADGNVERVTEFYDGMFIGVTDQSIISEEYLEADEKIMDAYGLTKEEKAENRKWATQYTVNVIGLDDATLKEIVEKTGTDESIMYDENVAPVIVVQSGELSTDNMRYGDEADFKFYEIEKMTDKKVGESFDINIYNPDLQENEMFPVTIAGFATNESLEGYFVFHSNTIWVITDIETLKEMDEIAACVKEGYTNITKVMYVKFNNTDCELYKQLGDMALMTMNSDNNEQLFVYSGAALDMENISKAINSVIRILLMCFVALTSVICMLNLYNSIKGRIATQKKEYGILRSMGMTDKQFSKMLLHECVGILTRSILIGVVIATPVIILIKNKLIELYGYIKLPIPWEVYILSITITIVAVFVITFISFKTEKSQNILEDIRRESV